jgi:hypothetical protein
MTRGEKTGWLLAITAPALLVGTLLAGALPAQDRGPLRAFMRKKLELSQGILRGLTMEDYELIQKNAKELRLLSEDAQWRITPNINYLRLSNEFQSLTDDLEARARARNLDGAALSYVDLTLNCIKCHRLVREEKLVSLPGGGGGEYDLRDADGR